MEKVSVVLGSPQEKKHSVRYFPLDKNDETVDSVYIAKSALGKPWPEKVRMTFEAAE